MRIQRQFIAVTMLLGISLGAIGCNRQPASPPASPGPGGVTIKQDVPYGSGDRVLNPVAPPPGPGVPVSSDGGPPPPGASAVPATVSADPLVKYREKDPSTGQADGDVEALQKIVDGYSMGANGLGGVAPLKDLSDLVKKGYLRELPKPPPGKKWAYDPDHWKVSLANQ